MLLFVNNSYFREKFCFITLPDLEFAPLFSFAKFGNLKPKVLQQKKQQQQKKFVLLVIFVFVRKKRRSLEEKSLVQTRLVFLHKN